MKFVGLVSGGKDSYYNIQKCLENGHELICLANLYPDNDEEEINSYMYQSAGHCIVPLQGKCLNKPLLRQKITKKSINTSLFYDCTNDDEVEDLFILLSNVLCTYPDVKGVSCGAIVSNYQRYRLENVCNRLNLIPLTYLWQCNRNKLFDELLDSSVHAILVKVAGIGLDPYKHLGKNLKTLKGTLLTLNRNYGLDICGEGGEYESLVLDMMIFEKYYIEINKTEIIIDSEDSNTGNLSILSATLKEKDNTYSYSKEKTTLTNITKSLYKILENYEKVQNCSYQPISIPSRKSYKSTFKPRFCFRRLKDKIFQTSPIISISEEFNLSPVEQLKNIFNQLRTFLSSYDISLNDCCFIHLYVSDMSLFQDINKEYMQWFNRNPPSRSCIQINLPDGVNVMLDALICIGSYTAMESGRKKQRQVLHVQCMSDWAPMCIGPYSQANIIADSVIYVAGQIPLIPGNMEIYPNTNDDPLKYLNLSIILCLRHVARILHSLNQSIVSTINCLVYINSNHEIIKQLETTNNLNLLSIYHMITYLIENNIFEPLIESETILQYSRDIHTIYQDIYEDNSDDNEENINQHSHLHLSKYPIAIVFIPCLPRNSIVEIEIVSCDSSFVSNKDNMIFEGLNSDSKDIVNFHSVDKVIIDEIESWPIWLSGLNIQNDVNNINSDISDLFINTKELYGKFNISTQSVNECICSGYCSYSNITNQLEIITNNLVISIIYQLVILIKNQFHKKNLSIKYNLKYLRLFYNESIELSNDIYNIIQRIILNVLDIPNYPIIIISTKLMLTENITMNESLLCFQFIGYDLIQIETEKWIHYYK